MSTRFAEREHRRAAGAPPLEDVMTQIDDLSETIDAALRKLKIVVRDLKSAQSALAELRRDVKGRR